MNENKTVSTETSSESPKRMGRNPFEKKAKAAAKAEVLKAETAAYPMEERDTASRDETTPPRDENPGHTSLLYRLTIGIPVGLAMISLKSIMVLNYLVRGGKEGR